MKSFTFRGIRKPWLILSEDKRKVPFPSISRNMVKIPGVDGALLTSSSLEPIVIEQPVRFIVNSDEEAMRVIDELASWLYTEAPVALQFDDEPGRTYYAVVQNTMEDFEKMVRVVRTGTIQFLCLDPFAYSDKITQSITSNPEIANDGTKETYPVFEIDVQRNITELSIINRSGDGQPAVVLGRPVSIDQLSYPEEELVFHDSMQGTSGWQQGAVVDVGEIAGNIAVDDKGFYAEDYGQDISNFNWQGPTLQRGIGESLTDFRADIKIESHALPKGSGLLDVYFRDANGNLIVKMGFGDYWQDRAENYGRAQVGSYDSGEKLEAYATHRTTWENFDGIMRVERKGNKYTFYFAQINDEGMHHARRVLSFTDTTGAYSTPISTVQVAFRKNTVYPSRISMRIKEIRIFRLNEPRNPAVEVPFIAQPGDILTIDNQNSLVLKNGEYANEFANLETEFFKLERGYNRLEVTPSDAGIVYAMYQKAYL